MGGIFFRVFFPMRHKWLWIVWCRQGSSDCLSLRVSVVFRGTPHIHPILFFFLYIFYY